jgi:phage shock protein A
MGWLENLSRVVRAQLNSWVQEAEDPEKVLEQAISQMEQEVIQLRTALAEAIATQKRTERQIYQQQKLAQDWHNRAQMAVSQGNDALAKEALQKWQAYRTNINPCQTQLTEQRQLIQQLRQNLQHLEQKFLEAKSKKSLYVARLRSAAASQRLQELVGNLENGSTSAMFAQMEAKILAMESQAELMGAAIDPIEKQFRALEGEDTVEEELTKLKAQDPQLRKLQSELDKL